MFYYSAPSVADCASSGLFMAGTTGNSQVIYLTESHTHAVVLSVPGGVAPSTQSRVNSTTSMLSYINVRSTSERHWLTITH